VASYEHGYKAGWDDASKAQSRDRARIGADFARSMQEISFTYHEAKSHLMRSFEPLLHDMIAQVLPATAAATLGQTILEALRPMAEAAPEVPVELVINPGNRDVVAQLLKTEMSVPVAVVEEETLGMGQAFVRLGAAEKSIDTEEVLTALGQAISAFFATTRPEEMRDAG
jgi:flagellar assembly protein FliH